MLRTHRGPEWRLCGGPEHSGAAPIDEKVGPLARPAGRGSQAGRETAVRQGSAARGPLVRSRPVSMRRTDRLHQARRMISRPPMMHGGFPRYRPVGSAGAYSHCNRRMRGRRQGHITRNIATELERTHQHPPPPSPPRTIHPSLFRPSMASSPSLCFRRHEQVRRLMVLDNG